jgi:hypothetical protein
VPALPNNIKHYCFIITNPAATSAFKENRHSSRVSSKKAPGTKPSRGGADLDKFVQLRREVSRHFRSAGGVSEKGGFGPLR